MSESVQLHDKREQLLAEIAQFRRCVVAFSAGVDSSVVAQAAFLALGDNALAVTGVSASLAAGELEQAQATAQQIGIRHIALDTSEFARSAYVANGPDRCYHCKTELYTQLTPLAAQFEADVVLNGANADDLGDYRPGMQAATEHKVHSPLAKLGLTKEDVRALARHWGLPVWDKPATPCLSSRVAYGEEVTPERLRQIDAAEQFLRNAGLGNVRVRWHRGELARIETPLAALPELCDPTFRTALTKHLHDLGFRYITLDLDGFRSGSQNEALVTVHELTVLH